MLELVRSIEVHETKKLEESGRLLPFDERVRAYKAFVEFEDLQAIQQAFGISERFILSKIKAALLPNLLNAIHKQAKKQNVKIEQTQAKDNISLEEQILNP